MTGLYVDNTGRLQFVSDDSPHGYRGRHRAPWSAQRFAHAVGRWYNEVKFTVFMWGAPQ